MSLSTQNSNSNKQRHRQHRLKLSCAAIILVCGICFAALAACEPAQKRAVLLASANTNEEALGNTAPYKWSKESGCITCHQVEAELLSDPNCVQARAHFDESCVGCHTVEKSLERVHEGISYASRPTAKKATAATVDAQSCTSCHGAMEDIAIRTVLSTVLTDSNGVTVNPHERPAGETHDSNPATCISCHNNHSKDLRKDAMAYCAQCHHRGEFRCGTCHEAR